MVFFAAGWDLVLDDGLLRFEVLVVSSNFSSELCAARFEVGAFFEESFLIGNSLVWVCLGLSELRVIAMSVEVLFVGNQTRKEGNWEDHKIQASSATCLEERSMTMTSCQESGVSHLCTPKATR